MLIRTHLQDLKEVTNNVHYENYRCRKLAGVAGGSVDKIPNRVREKNECWFFYNSSIFFRILLLRSRKSGESITPSCKRWSVKWKR